MDCLLVIQGNSSMYRALRDSGVGLAEDLP